MDSNVRYIVPSAPIKPSREDALLRIVYDHVAYGNVDVDVACDIDQNAMIAECIANHNWRPLSSELDELVLKHAHGHSRTTCDNTCVECGVNLGPLNPRQYCAKTYCENTNTINIEIYTPRDVVYPVMVAPNAPIKPSRETALRNTVLDALAHSTYNIPSCDEEAIIAECTRNRNWSPSTEDLKRLIAKYMYSNTNKNNSMMRVYV